MTRKGTDRPTPPGAASPKVLSPEGKRFRSTHIRPLAGGPAGNENGHGTVPTCVVVRVDTVHDPAVLQAVDVTASINEKLQPPRVALLSKIVANKYAS